MVSATKQQVILFLPFNSPGHMNGSIALADKLKQLYNYKCVFVVFGEAKFANLEQRGHKLVELEDLAEVDDQQTSSATASTDSPPNVSNGKPSDGGSDPMRTIETISVVFKTRFVKLYLKNAHQYEKVFREFEPSLTVIDDFFPPSYLLMHEDKYPWIQIHILAPNDFLMPKLSSGIMPCPWLGLPIGTKAERQRMQQEQPDKWQALLDEWKSKSDRVCPLLTNALDELYENYINLGLGHRLSNWKKPGAIMFSINSPYLNLYPYPDVMDYQDDNDIFQYPSRFLRCSSLVRESLPSQKDQDYWLKLLEEKSKGRKARVLFSLGTIVSENRNLIQRFVDIFAKDPDHLYIVSTGMSDKNIELADNIIGGTYIPQPFLLKHSDLAILHGGNNGLTECLSLGVPVIIMPGFADQLDNAQRVKEKKLGLKLNAQTSTDEEVLGAINQILDDTELRARVASVGQKMRARDDIMRVAELLHKLAQDKKLDQETLDKYNVTR